MNDNDKKQFTKALYIYIIYASYGGGKNHAYVIYMLYIMEIYYG